MNKTVAQNILVKNPYDDFPGFYELDNRDKRAFAPVTREQLENRHASMFSEWNLSGKTVLDLGSCLGATGQWVLFYGAKTYTGVDAQQFYVTQSRKLLDHYKEKTNIVQASIDDFLNKNKTQYDMVVMLGVLYGYLDYYKILKAVTSICKETLIIEGIYPFPDKGNPNMPIVEILPNQGMVVANAEESYSASGSRVSPSALEIILKTMGFEPTGIHPVPKRIKNSLDNFCGDPEIKYNVRYICSFRKTETICWSLNEVFSNIEKLPVTIEKTKWDEVASKSSSILKWITPDEKPITDKQWEFNEKVAKNFQYEAKTNIPDYDRVINYTIDIANLYLSKEAKIIDIGCAVGETLKRFYKNGFKNLYGTDNSSYMLEKAYQPESSSISYIKTEIFPLDLGIFHLVTANWTLHFVKKRELFLRDIYKQLHFNGYLILTEKILQSPETAGLYKKFKFDHGLNDHYIKYKEEALKEVLDLYPLDWYLITLRKIGFRTIDIINSNIAFTTFLIKK
ncbi:MAG: hypothetical protein B6I31_03625 [Desulfobacteraceae bacterium 4572_19]|nr:MAG: hypothetical protein B6I31_03625 [Desulfobacteraceae bacterium 4572_19]